MFSRISYNGKVGHYENNRSQPYKETARGIGVRIALRPHNFLVESLLVYIIKKPKFVLQQ